MENNKSDKVQEELIPKNILKILTDKYVNI